jgi:hypothetical protein
MSQVSASVIRVAHREYIHAIAGSTTFSASQTYAINAGLSTVFPWLGTLAQCYESYRFRQLKLVYQPNCATTTSGYVYIAVDFDPADAAPASLANAMNYEGTVGGPAWQAIVFDAAAKSMGKCMVDRFNRYNATGAGTPTHDLGNIFVIVGDQANTNGIGLLAAEYVVDLITPQIKSSGDEDF